MFLALSQNCEKRLLPSLCLSVRLPILVEQLCSHWTDFNEILCWNIFRKSVEKIQVSLKCDENNGYLTRRPIYIYIYIYDHNALITSENEKHFGKKFVQKIETHFVLNNFFFRKSCRLWDSVENIVDPDRPQMTIWRMRIAS